MNYRSIIEYVTIFVSLWILLIVASLTFPLLWVIFLLDDAILTNKRANIEKPCPQSISEGGDCSGNCAWCLEYCNQQCKIKQIYNRDKEYWN